MDVLSPAKLLVILVVALAVLGPDKLPTLAKQVGNLWRDFSRFRQKLESDVRGSFPDLPSTETITKAVRSPLSFLDTLAEPPPAADGGGPRDPGGDGSAHGSTGGPWDVGMLVTEFGESNTNWPTETVIGSEVHATEPPTDPRAAVRLPTSEDGATPAPVLVAQAAGIVHEVRAAHGATPDDAASN